VFTKHQYTEHEVKTGQWSNTSSQSTIHSVSNSKACWPRHGNIWVLEI